MERSNNWVQIFSQQNFPGFRIFRTFSTKKTPNKIQAKNFTAEDLIFVHRPGWIALCVEITISFLWTELKAAAVGGAVTMFGAGVHVVDGDHLFDPRARNIPGNFDVRLWAC